MAYYMGISTSESQNAGANQSTVYVTGTIYTGNQSYAGYNTSWAVVIAGSTVASGAGPTEMWHPSSFSFSGSLTFNHDANGYRGAVGTAAYFSGSGGYSPPALGIAGTTYGAIDYVRLPTAPASVTANATGPTVVVTSTEGSTPGPTITAYYVSYRASTNGGATWGAWSGESAMTSRAYTYTLTPGQTYQFRVRVLNTDGYSGFRESGTLFLTAGGKRYTGTNWALTVAAAKRFNGTSWVNLTTAKRFDGTNWVNLS